MLSQLEVCTKIIAIDYPYRQQECLFDGDKVFEQQKRDTWEFYNNRGAIRRRAHNRDVSEELLSQKKGR